MFWVLLFYIIAAVFGVSLLHSLKFVNFGIYFVNYILNSISLRIEGNKSQDSYTLIIGPTGSGKTTLFYKIKQNKVINTTTSIVPGVTKVNDNYLVDIPGNRRIVNDFILKYLNNSISTIFVIDSSDKPSFKDAAEILFLLLSKIGQIKMCSIGGSDNTKQKYKILILCNKSDLTSSRNISYIRDELERSMDRIFNNHCNIEDDLSYLIENGKPFSFDNIHFIDFQFMKLSLRNSFDDIRPQIDSFLK